ncbi:MAG: dihydrolipoamide acetyltransferase family protein [Rhodocyclaceae bacterium]|nr:dihydrolipoamide acetyltransferase family protein [Rhodocyclaceae bacterium]
MIEFTLPSLGADMEEGTLLEWKVAPGDTVKKGQALAIVDTAKSAVDVEIWYEGTVHELLVQPGEKVPVGTLLATLLEPGEVAPPPAEGKTPAPAVIEFETPAAPATAPVPSATQATAATRKPISPAARHRAKELGVDADSLAGTGPGGAVTLEDVEKAVLPPEAERAPTPEPEKPADKLSAMRQAIAAAMAKSKREIPHYYLSETIPMAHALAWLAEENARRPMNERVLPAALQIKAVARALERYPELNGFFTEGAFRPAEAIHPGIAISLRQGGLVAPALMDAGRKPLGQLMLDLADLVKRTRTGSLRSSELTRAGITITILGDQGVESVFGVIYPPQVALVGFGRISTRPWVDDGQVCAMPLVNASLSADHRVSDGHRGALFLAELRELLQRPEELAE